MSWWCHYWWNVLSSPRRPTTVNPIFVRLQQCLSFIIHTTLVPDQTWSLTDVRLAVTELLNCCLAEWIVSGHSTLCPAIKTVMMMLVRGCSIISYDDYHIILHHHTSDKLSNKIKVSLTAKSFFINISSLNANNHFISWISLYLCERDVWEIISQISARVWLKMIGAGH